MQTQKKIRILQYGLSNNLGGIETYLYKIASHLDFSKYKMDFTYIGETKPCFHKELSELGCNLVQIKTSRRQSLKQHKAEIREILQKGRYDIVHCNVASLSYITIALEALKLGCKIILVGHNGGVINGRAKWIHKINYFRLPHTKMTLVAVSELAGKQMFGNYPFIIHNNGLKTAVFSFNKNYRKNIRTELGINDEELIVHCGSMKPEKNHLFMLEVFAEYLKTFSPNARLVLVGTGYLRPQIESKISELCIENNVSLLGLRNDIPAILSAGDKFLFPSLYEGFPNALIEAECAGLPCIVSDTITRQAMVKDLCTLVSLEDSVSVWAENIHNAKVFDRTIYSSIINNMGLGIEENMNKLYEIYNNVIAER